MLTGMHSGTPERLQLGAGVFLKDFDFDGATGAADLVARAEEAVRTGRGLLGATRGGGSFIYRPLLRSLEADGVRTPFVGSTVIDGWDVRLTGTLLEITPENFARALVCADVTATGGVTVVQAREALTEADYLPRICWIGSTSRGAVLIELTGVLNVKGAAFTFRDRGEGELPFEFRAHAVEPGQDTAPFRIVFFS